MHTIYHSDEAALQALLQNKETGLDYLFTSYYNRLHYFAFQLVQDELLAEEIAADAFVKLWEKRSCLSADGSIKAWLYQTVRNSCIDHLRKVKRLRVNEAGMQTADTIEESVLHKLIATETINHIVRMLELLPPKCRQVFELHFLQGKSYEEIGKELNISAHTVRNQKIRAVRLIRQKMTLILFLLITVVYFPAFAF